MIAVRQLLFTTIRRPMKTTFVTSLGVKNFVTNVHVRVVLDDGTEGWGEAPTTFAAPHETVPAITAILREARALLAGWPIDDYTAAIKKLAAHHASFHLTLSGIETALFRADLARHGRDELAHWGGKSRTLSTDITIPFVPEEDELDAWLRNVIPQGFTTYKIKVGGKAQDDIAFVKAVHGRLSESIPQFAIRLDGNQGYTPRSYRQMVDALARSGIDIEFFEQPLHKDDHAGLKKIRGYRDMPVVLDETVFCVEDCRRALDGGLGDGVNIKIAKTGIAQAATIIKLVKSAGLKLMIGCMTETMVGLSAGIAMAAGSGRFDYVDLDSIHFLHHRRRELGIAISGPSYTFEER